MSKSPEIEIFEQTQYVYPKGYFKVQTLFAEKTVELGLYPNIQNAIFERTVIYRHLVGHNPSKNGPDPKWLEFTHYLSEKPDVSEQVWQFYTKQPHSIYKTDLTINKIENFGSFIQRPAIDKPTGDQKIELHFNNQHRGQPKSDFSRQFVKERIGDLTRLFESVKNRTNSDPAYNPKWVSLLSWMNNFPGVRSALPSAFVNSGIEVKPSELNFRSNSLWGQFLTNNGGVNIERYQIFQNKLKQSNNFDQLVSSFPIPVYLFRSPIKSFFEHYGIY